MTEAALWDWFLFGTGLPIQRAKRLLDAWRRRGHTLKSALEQLPHGAERLGLSAAEAGRLAVPGSLPEVSALTWEDPLYPIGLHALPLAVRPALLFYRGPAALLGRPILFVAPNQAEAAAAANLREAINLLVGDDLLLAAYEHSLQAEVLLEETAFGVGTALLFAGAGIDARRPSPAEDMLNQEQRLVVISPLPPTAQHQPNWTPILIQTAWAAAAMVVLTGDGAETLASEAATCPKPRIVLSAGPTDENHAGGPEITSDPSEILLWVERSLPAHAGSLLLPEEDDREDAPRAAADASAGKPPTPEEILATLSQGGAIPDVLRRRLEGDT